MSYRLIDSNALAIKYPEVNEMPCVFANLPDGIHGQFIDAQPEPSQVVRDIATIINNSKDMRVIASAQPEIIRCKDCRYTDEDGVCQSSKGLAIQDDDDFCSHAERRTDEQTD